MIPFAQIPPAATEMPAEVLVKNAVLVVPLERSHGVLESVFHPALLVSQEVPLFVLVMEAADAVPVTIIVNSIAVSATTQRKLIPCKNAWLRELLKPEELASVEGCTTGDRWRVME